MKLALALLVAAACSSAPPPPPPAPAPTPEPSPAPTPAMCGDKPACEAPATCVDYYGIAGARGPQFHSCEIKCDASTACPDGKKCATIADGPGSVCR
ncbi:MAG: hypothetical protein ABI678_26190 [Kofleriaceae bacterium]